MQTESTRPDEDLTDKQKAVLRERMATLTVQKDYDAKSALRERQERLKRLQPK